MIRGGTKKVFDDIWFCLLSTRHKILCRAEEKTCTPRDMYFSSLARLTAFCAFSFDDFFSPAWQDFAYGALLSFVRHLCKVLCAHC